MPSLSNRNFTLLPEEDFRALSDRTRNIYFSKMMQRLSSIVYEQHDALEFGGYHALSEIDLEDKLSVLRQIKYGAKYTDEVVEMVGHICAGIPLSMEARKYHHNKILEVLDTYSKEGSFSLKKMNSDWSDLSFEELEEFFNDFSKIAARVHRIKAPEVKITDSVVDRDGEVVKCGGFAGEDMFVMVVNNHVTFPWLLEVFYHEFIHSLQCHYKDEPQTCPEELQENLQAIQIFEDYARIWTYVLLEQSGIDKGLAEMVYKNLPYEKEAYIVAEHFSSIVSQKLAGKNDDFYCGNMFDEPRRVQEVAEQRGLHLVSPGKYAFSFSYRLFDGKAEQFKIRAKAEIGMDVRKSHAFELFGTHLKSVKFDEDGNVIGYEYSQEKNTGYRGGIIRPEDEKTFPKSYVEIYDGQEKRKSTEPIVNSNETEVKHVKIIHPRDRYMRYGKEEAVGSLHPR